MDCSLHGSLAIGVIKSRALSFWHPLGLKAPEVELAGADNRVFQQLRFLDQPAV
jgi:hypothetical protein